MTASLGHRGPGAAEAERASVPKVGLLASIAKPFGPFLRARTLNGLRTFRDLRQKASTGERCSA
jgi:hypothetical protein